MAAVDRRTMLTAAGLMAATVGSSSTGMAESTPMPAEKPSPKAAPPEVTRILARYIVDAKYDDLPANVKTEGVRTLLNWVGVAIGGSRHETVDIAVSALAPFSGPAQASLFGRDERFDIMNAAFVNGVVEPYLRLRRHAFEDRDPPCGSGRFGDSRLRRDAPRFRPRFPQRARARSRDGVQNRQRRLSQSLRRRLAHHRNRRRVRLGGGRRKADGAHRAADGLGAGARRFAASGLTRNPSAP